MPERQSHARLKPTAELVAQMLEDGVAPAELARRLGIAKSTVAYHMRRLGRGADRRFARRYDWKAVQEAYDSGLSARKCAKLFGFNMASWHGAVRRGEITTRPQAMPIERLLVADRPQTNRSHLKMRLIGAGLKENRCEKCGITDWSGSPLSMALHHKNGDGKDNRLENLELLCPNCHSQTDTYSGRNGHRGTG